jgi:poly-gamma-glutamate system protein
MKKLYWRPSGVSRSALVLIALVALGALTAVETLPVKSKQPHHADKLRAARLALDAMHVIKAEKIRRGISIDRQADPAESGLIGTALTPVTSNTGYLSAKRASLNPNFAAVVVQLLHEAGVVRGDVVAVGVSGSFPALGVATYAALHTLAASPIVVTSAASSEWGANHPDFSWLDMERVLVEKRVFGFRSVAASRGGIDDRGFGMTKEGRELLAAAIQRNGVLDIDAHSLTEAIDRRMQIYEEQAAGRVIKAYVNVGGGTASVGTHVGKKQLKSGLNTQRPRGAGLVDSVMLRFLERNVPVVHLSGVAELARRYGLTTSQRGIFRVGQGEVYVKTTYNRWLALGGIVIVLTTMLAFLRLGISVRLLRNARPRRPPPEPQQMV